MGKSKNNKKGPKGNVFKVAGAKSLKKTKAKAVNLGLKDIKQKVAEVDKQFVEISRTPKPRAVKQPPKTNPPPKQQKNKKKKGNVTKEEVSKAAEEIVKMDL